MPTKVTIHSVTDGAICIGDKIYRQTIALTADKVFDEWAGKAVTQLTEADFLPLLENNIEVIVLGTGPGNILPHRDLVFALARRGIGLEFMDTPAAARTFNVLVGEGRSVAAVLYIGPGKQEPA